MRWRAGNHSPASVGAANAATSTTAPQTSSDRPAAISASPRSAESARDVGAARAPQQPRREDAEREHRRPAQQTDVAVDPQRREPGDPLEVVAGRVGSGRRGARRRHRRRHEAAVQAVVDRRVDHQRRDHDLGGRDCCRPAPAPRRPAHERDRRPAPPAAGTSAPATAAARAASRRPPRSGGRVARAPAARPAPRRRASCPPSGRGRRWSRARAPAARARRAAPRRSPTARARSASRPGRRARTRAPQSRPGTARRPVARRARRRARSAARSRTPGARAGGRARPTLPAAGCPDGNPRRRAWRTRLEVDVEVGDDRLGGQQMAWLVARVVLAAHGVDPERGRVGGEEDRPDGEHAHPQHRSRARPRSTVRQFCR